MSFFIYRSTCSCLVMQRKISNDLDNKVISYLILSYLNTIESNRRSTEKFKTALDLIKDLLNKIHTHIRPKSIRLLIALKYFVPKFPRFLNLISVFIFCGLSLCDYSLKTKIYFSRQITRLDESLFNHVTQNGSNVF